jgi:DNA gyrase subunit A
MVALANIDAVIDLIKRSPSPAEAKVSLCERDWKPGEVVAMLERAGADATRPEDLTETSGLTKSGYRLSSIQAQAILDLRLHRLTGLEQEKLSNEYNNLLDNIKEFVEILSDPAKLESVIRTELAEIRSQYADERRTEITEDFNDLTIEDLIPEASLVVTLSHAGYAKAQPVADYQAQRRGGRGRAATRTRDEDFIETLFVADSHDTLLCFSSLGKVYWLKVYQLPQASFGSRGRPIINLLPLAEDERITAVLPVKEYEEDRYVVFATSGGTVKRTPLSAFSRPRSSGIIAIELRGNDSLVGVGISGEEHDIMLIGSSGKAIRFEQSAVRSMGRTAAGVRGLKLAKPGDSVIALIIVGDGPIVIATENGYGKLTDIDEFPRQGRGGQGVIAIRTSGRNGAVVGARQVSQDDELMLISQVGTLVRTPVADVSVMGRNTQGVRLIRLDEGDRLVGLERVEGLQEEDSPTEE